MSFTQRTHDCGAIRAEHAGQTVTLNGWAHRVRDLGGLLFVDLRDRTGLCQLFIDPAKAPDLRSETCLSVTGTVKLRDEKNRNANMPTGDIEIDVTSAEVLNAVGVLPFPVSDEGQMSKVNEELRVKYRYLDLRRPSMYRKMALRAALISAKVKVTRSTGGGSTPGGECVTQFFAPSAALPGKSDAVWPSSPIPSRTKSKRGSAPSAVRRTCSYCAAHSAASRLVSAGTG